MTQSIFQSISLEQLKTSPQLAPNLTMTEMYSLPTGVMKEIRLAGLKMRLASLIDRVPMLKTFADEQGIHDIRSLEDGAKLLFPHSAYKSYPLPLLEKSRFDQLTRWMDNLTSFDLSGVDASKCRGIDEWIDLLDAETPIRIRHSSGTTGKLSFLPRSTVESLANSRGWIRFHQGFKDEADAAGIGDMRSVPVVLIGYRKGAMGNTRNCDNLVSNVYGGDESMILPSNPGRMSADVLSLSGRMRAAEAKGELGKLQLSPYMLARREEFQKEQDHAAERLSQFFIRAKRQFDGQRVVVLAQPPGILDLMALPAAAGIKGLFAPKSLGMFGGGRKGRAFPDGFEDQTAAFFGFPYPRSTYGMSEMVAGSLRACPSGHYHPVLNVISYLLDPRTGALLPESGTQTGRYGFIDLCTETYWGGFLTGDEVTMTWDVPCPCGRTGPYIHQAIRRYSEAEGGDDKITCAGAPDMHDKALDFITRGLV